MKLMLKIYYINRKESSYILVFNICLAYITYRVTWL